MLGFTFSMDEISKHFKGHHADKRRMMYKTEGGWLHKNAFFGNDTHIKYLCGIILYQKHI